MLTTYYTMATNDVSRTPVLFITLTEPNATPFGLHKENVRTFLHRLSHKTKSHLFVRGTMSETENSHSHLIVEIPTSELEGFNNRLPRFQSFKIWGKKHKWFQRFDPSRAEGCFHYVDRHEGEAFEENFCPKQSSACRSGFCPKT